MEENKTYWTCTFDKTLLYKIAANVFLSDELCLKVAAEPILLMRCSAPLAGGRRWHHHTLSFLSLWCVSKCLVWGRTAFPVTWLCSGCWGGFWWKHSFLLAGALMTTKWQTFGTEPLAGNGFLGLQSPQIWHALPINITCLHLQHYFFQNFCANLLSLVFLGGE